MGIEHSGAGSGCAAGGSTSISTSALGDCEYIGGTSSIASSLSSLNRSSSDSSSVSEDLLLCFSDGPGLPRTDGDQWEGVRAGLPGCVGDFGSLLGDALGLAECCPSRDAARGCVRHPAGGARVWHVPDLERERDLAFCLCE